MKEEHGSLEGEFKGESTNTVYTHLLCVYMFSLFQLLALCTNIPNQASQLHLCVEKYIGMCVHVSTTND